MPTTATDFLFRSLYHQGLCLVGEAAGASSRIRGIYRAAVLNGNPKHGIVLTRQLLGQIDETETALRILRANVLALAAEIEAAIPTEPTEPQP